ncbi:SDR family oxidoreductase [Lichenifustis flavocetrariae]|uniref:SDR family oxidoreductase n=1 Tax=Lichenifustis flavocetrariae TaxID=2949735 RepID=A0AA42CMF0_9HYPH|nr:SDR family oxidoreductase [Lichenifustis flavocetrariae]MCW6511506.1 SDR family oxidoreductase [Lichenifustis flavocetrariae]
MTTIQSEQTRPALPSHDLTGKRVVVVGGKTGIGLGIAQAAHAAGASVTVASRRSASVADHPELAPFEQISLDIDDEEAVRAAFDAMGALDHLVVAAGSTDGSWGAFMDDDMRGVRSYTTNKYLGSWACARYAGPRLPPHGSITLLTGGIAARPKLGMTSVTSAFAAVEALGRSLALELGPIRVNTIRPGFIDTDFWTFLSEADAAAVREKVRAKFPARRLGQAADVGHAAVFLMTNPYVTGTVLDVTGGEQLVDWAF